MTNRAIPNKWRNRAIVGGLGIIATCICLAGTVFSNRDAPATTATPNTQFLQSTDELPAATRTVEEIVLPTNTRRPTDTPILPTATRTRIATRTVTFTPTPVPSLVPSATRPPTITPRPDATSRPANTQPPAATQAIAGTQAPTVAPTIAATQPPATIAPTQAPAGITLVSLTSPIGAGADASLVIQTTPGASCFLSYVTASGTTSSAQGLGATTANGEGRCGWTWRIGSNTNPGTGKLFVSAGTANASYDIVIQ